MTEIPVKVNELIDEILQKVREYPTHELHQMVRMRIYNTFGDQDDPTRKDFITQLGVLNLKKVVTIKDISDKDVLDSTVGEVERFLIHHDEPYYRFTQEALLEEFRLSTAFHPDTPWKVQVIYSMAYKVRREVELGVVFDDTYTYRYFDPYNQSFHPQEFLSDGYKTAIPPSGLIHFSCFYHNDEDAAHRLESDSAGTAAILYSYNLENRKSSPEKLLEFWEWWLTEAIPQAWAKANKASPN